MRFHTSVELGGKTATGLPVPDDIVAALSDRKRAAVIVGVNGYRYHTTLARMGGRFLVPLSAENRMGAGVAAGDEVDVDIELDQAPREVELPDDLAAALAGDADARGFFDGLSFTHRKEWARWITEAKKAETRKARVAKAIELLRAGQRTH
jgi:hypothetical protein